MSRRSTSVLGRDPFFLGGVLLTGNSSTMAALSQAHSLSIQTSQTVEAFTASRSQELSQSEASCDFFHVSHCAETFVDTRNLREDLSRNFLN